MKVNMDGWMDVHKYACGGIWYPSVSEDYGVALVQRGCGWPVRFGNDSPCGRGHRWSLTLISLRGLQPFFSFSFRWAAERASLWNWRDLSALSVSRLTIWGLLLPSCSGRCSRLLGPSCTHLWIAAVVCLSDVFPAQVLRRGGLWGSVRRSCMAEPARTSLFQQRGHAGAPTSFQDNVVWDLVLPGNVQNASELAHAKNIELPLLPDKQCPGLTAIQEGAHDASSMIWIFVCSVSLLLFHAFFVSLVMVVAALPMRLLSSASSERVSEIAEPRKTKSWMASSS